LPTGEPTWAGGGFLDVIGVAVTRQRLATKQFVMINHNFMSLSKIVEILSIDCGTSFGKDVAHDLPRLQTKLW
jgi:hypothetical protein